MHIKSVSTHLKTVYPVGDIAIEYLPQTNLFNIHLLNQNVSITSVSLDVQTAKQISDFIKSNLKYKA